MPRVSVLRAVAALLAVCASCGSPPDDAVEPGSTTFAGSTSVPVGQTTESSPTTVSTTSTAIQLELTQTTEAALAIKDEFFSAYNDGRTGDVLALFAPDVRVVNFIGRTCSFPGSGCADLDELATLIAWDAAQDPEWTPHSCSTEQWSRMVGGEMTPQNAIEIVCDVTYGPMLYRAAGAEIRGPLVFIVAGDQVIELAHAYDPEEYRAVEEPFIGWVSAAHPDELEKLIDDNWRDPILSLECAELRNSFAEEYAATLAE